MRNIRARINFSPISLSIGEALSSYLAINRWLIEHFQSEIRGRNIHYPYKFASLPVESVDRFPDKLRGKLGGYHSVIYVLG